MLKVLDGRLGDKDANIDRSEMLLLGSVIMTDMFTQGWRGQIVQYVLNYFLIYYEAWEVRDLMPLISMIINICNQQNGVPYQIIKGKPLFDPFQIGFAMYWPMNFNLVQDCCRFSRKYELPYCGQFPRPLIIADDTKFIYFMQGLHLFLLVQLREFKAVFSPAEFRFITKDPAIMINLCTYLGFGCLPDVLTRQS